MIFERVVKPVMNLGRADEAALTKPTETFHNEAAMLDRHLAGQPYVAGNTLTLADFSVAAPLFFAERAQVPLDRYDNIRAWFERVSALPAWQTTKP